MSKPWFQLPGDAAISQIVMASVEAPSVPARAVRCNPETRKPFLALVGYLIREGLTRVEAVITRCWRRMRLTVRRAESDGAASAAQLLSSMVNDG